MFRDRKGPLSHQNPKGSTINGGMGVDMSVNRQLVLSRYEISQTIVSTGMAQLMSTFDLAPIWNAAGFLFDKYYDTLALLRIELNIEA